MNFMNFEIFGITPFRGLWTLFTSTEFLSIILAILLIGGVLGKLFGINLIVVIRFSVLMVFEGVKLLTKLIAKFIIQTYMIIMFEIDSRKQGYMVAEYWKSRKITLKGIFAVDLTGTETVTIQHPAVILNVLNIALKLKRIFKNVKISVSKEYTSMKERVSKKLSLLK